MTEIINNEFNKIITDLIKDLLLVFPDIIQDNNNQDIINVLEYIQYIEKINNTEDNTQDNTEDNTENNNENIKEKYIKSCNNLLNYSIQVYQNNFLKLYKKKIFLKTI